MNLNFKFHFQLLHLTYLLTWQGIVQYIYIYIYIQQDATLYSLFISGNCSTCFGCYFHPSSGAHTTLSTASGICQTVTATCRYSKCSRCMTWRLIAKWWCTSAMFNPLNAELNLICYLLALLAHHFLHVSRIRVKSLTLRLLMSHIYIYICVCCVYGAPILDVSRSHTTTHHSR